MIFHNVPPIAKRRLLPPCIEKEICMDGTEYFEPYQVLLIHGIRYVVNELGLVDGTRVTSSASRVYLDFTWDYVMKDPDAYEAAVILYLFGMKPMYLYASNPIHFHKDLIGGIYKHSRETMAKAMKYRAENFQLKDELDDIRRRIYLGEQKFSGYWNYRRAKEIGAKEAMRRQVGCDE